MNLQMKNPATPASMQPGLCNTNQQGNSTTKPPKKWQRVLAAFLTGRSFNRFEAERQLHDHALHSTVAMLQFRGLVIDRTMESVPGYQGLPTRIMRYWLSPASVDAAKALLGIGEEV